MKIPPELDGLSKREIIRRYILLEVRLAELERRLLAYENAHTPPSQQKGERHYPQAERSPQKRGAPVGHEGTTRPQPTPTETKTLALISCPECHTTLIKPTRVERRVIEELPEPQPIRVIEFFVPHYDCPQCKKEIIATHPELPKTGRLGNNLQAQIALAKYEDRLPPRKIAQMLNRQYNLYFTAATILSVLQRVADCLKPEYEKIKLDIRLSMRIHADETGSKKDGEKHWLWLFMSPTSVLFLFRKRREAKVIKEILGENYLGVLTCDGLKAYHTIVKIIQRCWAHLLRDAKFLAQKHGGQAKVLYNSLCELFNKIKQKRISYEEGTQQMSFFLGIAKAYKELRKIAVLLENGFKQWFTCVLYPDVEPTNNKAEQTLREFVIQRKIYPTFRSEQGFRTTEILLSFLATWRLRGLNTLQALRQTLRS